MTTQELNLEVGKTYLNRLGDKVTIIGESKYSSWRFEGNSTNGIQSFTERLLFEFSYI